jgi:hypothetical protein
VYILLENKKECLMSIGFGEKESRIDKQRKGRKAAKNKRYVKRMKHRIERRRYQENHDCMPAYNRYHGYT